MTQNVIEHPKFTGHGETFMDAVADLFTNIEEMNRQQSDVINVPCSPDWDMSEADREHIYNKGVADLGRLILRLGFYGDDPVGDALEWIDDVESAGEEQEDEA